MLQASKLALNILAASRSSVLSTRSQSNNDQLTLVQLALTSQRPAVDVRTRLEWAGLYAQSGRTPHELAILRENPYWIWVVA